MGTYYEQKNIWRDEYDVRDEVAKRLAKCFKLEDIICITNSVLQFLPEKHEDMLMDGGTICTWLTYDMSYLVTAIEKSLNVNGLDWAAKKFV